MSSEHQWRGWYCHICKMFRPNEAFSGKGRVVHICQRCKKRPKHEIQEIIAFDDLHSIFRQKNISEKKLRKIENIITIFESNEIRKLAEVILKIGRIHPYKRKRLRFLKLNHPDLWAQMVEVDLIFPDEIPESDSELYEFNDDPQNFESLYESPGIQDEGIFQVGMNQIPPTDQCEVEFGCGDYEDQC